MPKTKREKAVSLPVGPALGGETIELPLKMFSQLATEALVQRLKNEAELLERLERLEQTVARLGDGP